jgi:hypothetical protein
MSPAIHHQSQETDLEKTQCLQKLHFTSALSQLCTNKHEGAEGNEGRRLAQPRVSMLANQ